MHNDNKNIFEFNLGFYFCFFVTTYGSVQHLKVSNDDSLVQVIQALAVQINKLRNKKQSFHGPKMREIQTVELFLQRDAFAPEDLHYS